MQNIKLYIEDCKKEIVEVTEFFYQQNMQSALNKMNSILNRIETLYAMVNKVDNVELENKVAMIKILNESMNAMESEDYVLLADILQYDMIDLLDVYLKKID